MPVHARASHKGPHTLKIQLFKCRRCMRQQDPTHWRHVQSRQPDFRGNWEKCLQCWTGSTRSCQSLLSRVENRSVAISLSEQGLSVRALESAERSIVLLFPYTLLCTYLAYSRRGRVSKCMHTNQFLIKSFMSRYYFLCTRNPDDFLSEPTCSILLLSSVCPLSFFSNRAYFTEITNPLLPLVFYTFLSKWLFAQCCMALLPVVKEDMFIDKSN